MRKIITTLTTLSLFVAGCGSRGGMKRSLEHSQAYQLTESVIGRVNIPNDSFSYIQKHIAYVKDPYDEVIQDDWRSLEWTLEHGLGDCDDFSIASAGMLQDNGYPPKILFLGGNPTGFGAKHTVHLIVDENGEFGSVGLEDEDTKSIERFSTIDDLIKSWCPGNCFSKYAIIDLSKIEDLDYIHSRENLWPKIVKPLLPLKWTYVK